MTTSLAAGRFQNHEVIQVPVDDGRQGQESNVMELEPKRPAPQVHLGRHLDQPPERDAIQRNRMAAPERVQVDPMPMIGCNHGQTSQPALSRLCLQDRRQAGSATEVQESPDHPSILRCRRGSKIQSTSVRFSRMISALRDMSGCSGNLLPLATTSGRSSATVAV